MAYGRGIASANQRMPSSAAGDTGSMDGEQTPGPADTTRSLVEWLAGDGTEPEPGEQQPSPMFADAAGWVQQWLAPTLELKTAQGSAGGANWCPQWFDHPQVVLRLTAAWREWETARITEAMNRWWLDFDTHLAAITGEYGPFSRCRNGHQPTLAPLASMPAGHEQQLTLE